MNGQGQYTAPNFAYWSGQDLADIGAKMGGIVTRKYTSVSSTVKSTVRMTQGATQTDEYLTRSYLVGYISRSYNSAHDHYVYSFRIVGSAACAYNNDFTYPSRRITNAAVQVQITQGSGSVLVSYDDMGAKYVGVSPASAQNKFSDTGGLASALFDIVVTALNTSVLSWILAAATLVAELYYYLGSTSSSNTYQARNWYLEVDWIAANRTSLYWWFDLTIPSGQTAKLSCNYNVAALYEYPPLDPIYITINTAGALTYTTYASNSLGEVSPNGPEVSFSTTEKLEEPVSRQVLLDTIAIQIFDSECIVDGLMKSTSQSLENDLVIERHRLRIEQLYELKSKAEVLSQNDYDAISTLYAGVLGLSQ